MYSLLLLGATPPTPMEASPASAAPAPIPSVSVVVPPAAPAAAPSSAPPAASPYETQLGQLAAMGFADREMNEQLLSANKGDLPATIAQLIG